MQNKVYYVGDWAIIHPTPVRIGVVTLFIGMAMLYFGKHLQTW